MKGFPKLAWDENKANLPGSFSVGMPELLPRHLTINEEANTSYEKDSTAPTSPHQRLCQQSTERDEALQLFKTPPFISRQLPMK